MIRVFGGAGGGFVANGASRDFGEATAGQPHIHGGSIVNDGTQTLELASVHFDNEDNCSVTLATTPASSIAPGIVETWTASVVAHAAGPYSFALVVEIDAPEDSDYVVTFTGDAIVPSVVDGGHDGGAGGRDGGGAGGGIDAGSEPPAGGAGCGGCSAGGDDASWSLLLVLLALGARCSLGSRRAI